MDAIEAVVKPLVAKLVALEKKNKELREALDLAWAWMEDEEVKGCLHIAAIHHAAGSDRTREWYAKAKAAKIAALGLEEGNHDG